MSTVLEPVPSRELVPPVREGVTGAPAPPPAARRRRGSDAGGGPARAAWLFLAPALVVLGVFFALPILAALFLSLTDFDIYAIGDASTARFVGLRNYARLLENPTFWLALRNTLYFVAVGGPLSVAVSLGAALLVNAKGVRLKGLFRTIYFAPVVTTLVAVAAVWRYLYHPRAGLLNAMLGLVGVDPIDWLGDPAWAMPAIILLAVWKNFGYNMIIFVAGLQNVPEELYEAAHVDGANGWQRFRHITLPMLAPTFLFVGVITMIGYFQLFAEPYVMTQGGPLNATLSVVLLMYQEGFRWWNMGYAAALAFVLFLIILAATLVQLRLQPRES
jgi:multiple sugar transport system permease protein